MTQAVPAEFWAERGVSVTLWEHCVGWDGTSEPASLP